MADVTVLLTCAGQRVDIVRAFREALDGTGHDGRVLVSDLDPLSPSLFAADGAVELPPVSDPAYGAAVADACRREGVRAVLPLTDLDPVLARAAPAIDEAGARVFLPARGRPRLPGQVGVPPDAGAGGLPSPPTWLPDDADPAALPYPVLVKPRLGFARATSTAAPIRTSSRSSCATRRRERHPAGAARRGVQHRLPRRPRRPPLGAVPRRMIQAKGGEQIKGETLDDPQLTELGAATVASLGLAGPSTVQCFREDRRSSASPTSTPASGRLPAAQAAGAAYPETIIAIAAGERPPARVGAHAAGVVMTRFLDQTILRREPRGPPHARPLGSAGRGARDHPPGLRPRAVGRPLILAATVAAALVGLILTFVTETTYVATSEVYLGQATTISGTPVSTPTTNPATATARPATTSDAGARARREPSRVRDGVEVTAPRSRRRGRQPADDRDGHLHRREPRHRAARREPLRGGDPRAGARELGRDRRHLRGGGGPLVGAGRPPARRSSMATGASSPRTRAASRRSSCSRSCRAPASSSRWPPPSSPSSASTWSRSASTASRTLVSLAGAPARRAACPTVRAPSCWPP